MQRAALEEKEVSWRECASIRRVLHPECAFAGEYVEVFIAGRMVVGRGSPVDAKDACAGCLLVGQVGVHQQRFCRRRERLRDLVQIEATETRTLALLIHGNSGGVSEVLNGGGPCPTI